MATIVTKNSSTASAVPTTSDLVQGELAVNVTDKRLFTENASTQIVELGTNPSTVTTATATVTGTLTANGTFASSNAVITGGSINSTPIGATTPSTGNFSALSISGTAITATANELNLLDGVTATTAELNFIDGVTSSIQTQLNTKAPLASPTFTGTVTADGLSLGDNDIAQFGNGNDLYIYHDGTDSFIKETGAGSLKIWAKDFEVYNAGGTETLINADVNAGVQLYFDNAIKIATTSTGIDVSGTATADGLSVNGTAIFNTGSGSADNVVITGTDSSGSTAPDLVLYRNSTSPVDGDNIGMIQFRGNDDASTERNYAAIFASINDVTSTSVDGKLSFAVASANTTAPSAGTTFMTIEGGGDISFYEDTGTTAKLTWDASDESLNFADNGKATFGNSNDLEIYHDGSHSYISDVGQGDLRISGSSLVDIKCGADVMFRATEGGATQLRYGGSLKLATTSTGIDVTGSVVADGLDILNINIGNNANTIASSASLFFDIDSNDNQTTAVFNVTRNNKANNIFNIDENGDISFYEDTGTTPKFFWDASAESLGVGNQASATPSGSDLTVGSADNPTITLRNTRSDTNWDVEPLFGSLNWYTNDGSGDGTGVISSIQVISPTSTGSEAEMAFSIGTGATNNFEAMRIDSSGNVGIGTTSPQESLHTSGNIRFGDTAPAEIYTNSSELRLGVDRNNDNGASDITFYADNSEKMRIDSSGNLLVGTTITGLYASSSEVGSRLGDGVLMVSRSASTPAYFNRLSSNGNIIDFRKDGTTVGSIGTVGAGSEVYIAGNTTGLQFSDTAADIRPCTATGASSDATTDLGDAVARFKDLYLSGGIYLGGTGADNLLNDYEEGTFTVAFEDSSGNAATLGNDYGYYTKVGRQVTIVVDIANIDTTGLTLNEDIRITGLPFSVFNATGGAQFIGSSNSFNIVSAGASIIAFIQDNIQYIQLKNDDSSLAMSATLSVVSVQSAAADIRFSLTYFAA